MKKYIILFLLFSNYSFPQREPYFLVSYPNIDYTGNYNEFGPDYLNSRLARKKFKDLREAEEFANKMLDKLKDIIEKASINLKMVGCDSYLGVKNGYRCYAPEPDPQNQNIPAFLDSSKMIPGADADKDRKDIHELSKTPVKIFEISSRSCEQIEDANRGKIHAENCPPGSSNSVFNRRLLQRFGWKK